MNNHFHVQAAQMHKVHKADLQAQDKNIGHGEQALARAAVLTAHQVFTKRGHSGPVQDRLRRACRRAHRAGLKVVRFDTKSVDIILLVTPAQLLWGRAYAEFLSGVGNEQAVVKAWRDYRLTLIRGGLDLSGVASWERQEDTDRMLRSTAGGHRGLARQALVEVGV